MTDARAAFTETLLVLARANPAIYALASDSRGSVTLGAFAGELPGQFVECGIAEQDAVGIAAGLALAGKRPFVCGPACFYSLRAAEQIKVDVAYSGMNVKIIGVSGGISYGALGSTHHALQDIALMCALYGLEVLLPADGRQMEAMTRYLAASDRPAYVRMGRGKTPDIYDTDACFTPGRANVLRNGGRAAIIACGEMVYHALVAADLLGDVMVVDMHTIKPLDTQAILAAAQTGLVVTLEEHSCHGGLGGAVSEALAQACPTRMAILGLPDEPIYNGSNADVLAHYGLDGAAVAARVRALLGDAV